MPSNFVAEGYAIRSRIQEYLARHVVNRNSIGDAYIRWQDVERAWSGHETIEHALYPAVLSGSEVDFIREELLTFLSILVYIDAHDFLLDFRTNILDVWDNANRRYSDSKLPLKEKDVPALGNFVLRNRFLAEQYLFIPEVLVESAAVKQIDDQRRLPFESVSKDLFAGAYGKIDKVGISPSYFKTRHGWTFPQTKYVACKRFHAQLPSSYEPKRELDNLKVLKDSITSHDNIRLHLAIILHKSEHLILLPWADHLDLEIFLYEGHDFLGQEIYDFKRRFKNIQHGTMINDICTQMHHVADALKWLHDGIITHGAQNRIRFAHMDLKPNNILIDNDDGLSAVGKWVLTDFGISAFKEEDGTSSDNLVSVRDYYQNLTINTPPRRDPGAYQPPEVEHMDNRSSERRNTPKEGSAGRRGDIWSFACIFAEVLTFSLGQAALLKEFRKVRKARHKNDYFYEVDRETLQPDNSNTSYRVRPQIVEWLRALPGRYSFPKKAIDCCVETIERVLVVDGSMRPKAYELLKMFSHVANHVDLARAPGGLPPNCPLEHPTPVTSPTSAEPVVVEDMTTAPPIHIRRTNSVEEESLFNYQRPQDPRAFRFGRNYDPTPHVNAPLERLPHALPGLLTTLSDCQDSLLDPGNSSPPPRQSATGLGIFNNLARTSSISEVTQTTMVSRPASRESRRDLHGVMINQDRARRIDAVVERASQFPWSKGKIISFNLCPSGRRIAYLTEVKRAQEIHLFDIRLANRQLEKSVPSGLLSNPIPLPSGTNWENVVSVDDYTVAWGNGRSGAKQVYISSNRIGSKVLNGSELKWLSTLITVVISPHGSLVFVCTRSILYTVMEGELNYTDGSPFREFIRAKTDHSFTHAAFNDDGSLLYAWEYGRPDDCLSVWRIEQFQRKLVLPVDSEGSYPSKQQGVGTATLLPYNTYHGCIIHAQGHAFFPAQIRSTLRGSKLTLEKKIVTIPNAVAACIYGDHSLLVTTKGKLHTRVWENRIVGGAIHVIEQAREPIIEFRCRPGDDVQMRVVTVGENSDDLVIVLCTADGRVFMVPVVAQSGTGA